MLVDTDNECHDTNNQTKQVTIGVRVGSGRSTKGTHTAVRCRDKQVGKINLMYTAVRGAETKRNVT